VDAGTSASDGDQEADRPAASSAGDAGPEREPADRHDRRGVGLGRRGGRRGTSPAAAHGSQTDASATEGGTVEGASASPGGSSGDGDVVEHMVKNYAGVGRKTAEALVDAFGAEVFSVIDEQPDRITNVLPEHRAQAVIEAREAERQDAGSPDGA
jgi:hypothetical protein